MKIAGGAVEQSYDFRSGETLTLKAETIRRQTTGIHARLYALLGPTPNGPQPLTWDTFNVERQTDRTHFANKAWDKLKTMAFVKDTLTLKDWSYRVDLFCASLWQTWAGQYRARLEGDEDVQPLNFLLEPYIIEGCGTIIFAPPGAGKSYLTMAMGVAIDAGRSQLWRVTQTKGVFVNLERAAKLVTRRLHLVNLALGEEGQRKLLMVNARGWSLSDVVDALRQTIEEDGAQFVVLDSLSRSGYGDLNEAGPANSIMDALNNLGVTWLAIAHSPKANKDTIFGSQMFQAAADVVIQTYSQTKEDGTVGVGLKVVKANDIRKPPMAVYAMEFDDYGLNKLRLARLGEFPEVEAEKPTSAANQIRDYLLEVGKDDPSSIAEQVGVSRQYVHEVLKGSGYTHVGKEGKRMLYAVTAERDA